jgi:hypothetical protein
VRTVDVAHEAIQRGRNPSDDSFIPEFLKAIEIVRSASSTSAGKARKVASPSGSSILKGGWDFR